MGSCVLIFLPSTPPIMEASFNNIRPPTGPSPMSPASTAGTLPPASVNLEAFFNAQRLLLHCLHPSNHFSTGALNPISPHPSSYGGLTTAATAATAAAAAIYGSSLLPSLCMHMHYQRLAAEFHQLGLHKLSPTTEFSRNLHSPATKAFKEDPFPLDLCTKKLPDLTNNNSTKITSAASSSSKAIWS